MASSLPPQPGTDFELKMLELLSQQNYMYQFK
eukprot:CAMPEP_0181298878 /NCGR_PEP_ID=MMETSP1101-20121128/6027_1 /TAXON_ID=46948 /ORGANISM="Rhodomonas abbreviata, Strain Caron Lab Isolate" /LENGTH=31 /DNA_ID= /DNA_START= /DNA_END= /DNA_ORIENTATION=